MPKFNLSSPLSINKKLTIKQLIPYVVICAIIIFLSCIFQTGNFLIYNTVPNMTLAIVCAIGFIMGERIGAVMGIYGGVLIDLLGGLEISLSPIAFMLCGYLCGALLNLFLSKNFPSFLLFGMMSGLISEIFTLIYHGINSSRFNLWDLLTKLIIPEYLAYILCLIPAYLFVLGIYLLFKGKDNKSKTLS